jgi:hypothetical protein
VPEDELLKFQRSGQFPDEIGTRNRCHKIDRVRWVVMIVCLLLIDKARTKDKTYI